MRILALGYLGFESPNFEEWLTFGPEIYGLGLAPRGAGGSVRLRIDDRHHRLSIHAGDDHQISYIGWELNGRLEFEEALNELSSKGYDATLATAEEIEDRRVTGMAHFFDPAGFRHEIFFGQQFEPRSFTPGRPISGFVADELGVGHVVLAVPEVCDSIRDFATKVLGLRIFAGYRAQGADGALMGAEFYRCNPRSHCLAYVTAPGRKGVTHVCIEAHSLDDVGRAYDLVEERNVPVKMTLGRHTSDTLVSFYVRTPTGFELEYGAGGMLIDDDNVFVALKPDKTEMWGHKFKLSGWGPTVKPIDRQKT